MLGFKKEESALYRITRLETELRSQIDYIKSNYIKGRLRTDITVAPTSSTDVNSTDKLYDMIILPTEQYILINDAGSYEWRKITLSSF